MGLQLLFLKFGRDAERQADELGFKYMVGEAYDPREMAKMFVTLERSSAAEGPRPGVALDAPRSRRPREEGRGARRRGEGCRGHEGRPRGVPRDVTG